MIRNVFILLTLVIASCAWSQLRAEDKSVPVVSGTEGYRSSTVADQSSWEGEKHSLEADDGSIVLRAEIFLDNDFSMKGGVAQVQYYGYNYDRMLELVNHHTANMSDIIVSMLGLHDAKLQDCTIEECADSTGVPFILATTAFTSAYGKVNGSRLLLPVDPFHSLNVPQYKDGRTQPYVVDNNACIDDEIVVHLPKGVKIEGVPVWIKVEDGKMTGIDIIQNKYGSILSMCTLKDELCLYIKNRVVYNSGEYPVNEHEDFIRFFSAISARYAETIVVGK